MTPAALNAESVQWSSIIEGTLWYIGDSYDAAHKCVPTLSNAQVTVSYHATGIDPTTGASVCGQSIPRGATVRFQFAPHEFQDIYWFGTGHNWDSPYGDWTQSARPPQGDMCVEKNFFHDTGGTSAARGYASLAIDPPQKTVDVPSNFTCGPIDASGSVTCTADAVASSAAVFTFERTIGHFYTKMHWVGMPNQCVDLFARTDTDGLLSRVGASAHLGGATYTCTGDAPFDLIVPAQSISCPITVLPPVGEPPATPTLSSAVCTVGAPHTISAMATDPDDGELRYGIDWDANGTVDQWIPGSGFVASDSTQTASRTYAIAGSKTVKVLAQDTNGLSSGWASVSFNCAGSTTVGLNDNGEGATDETGGGGTAQLLPDLDLRVVPSLVKSGNTTKVNWSSANVQSCAVSGQNGDAWSGLLSALGGNLSKPITSETTYTLSCLTLDGTTLTKSATVKIIPTFQEL